MSKNKNNKPVENAASISASEPKLRNKKSLDEKIAVHQKAIESSKAAIAKHEEAIENLRNPKPRISKKAKMKSVMDLAQKAGLTPEEIAEKLGIEL